MAETRTEAEIRFQFRLKIQFRSVTTLQFIEQKKNYDFDHILLKFFEYLFLNIVLSVLNVGSWIAIPNLTPVLYNPYQCVKYLSALWHSRMVLRAQTRHVIVPRRVMIMGYLFVWPAWLNLTLTDAAISFPFIRFSCRFFGFPPSLRVFLSVLASVNTWLCGIYLESIWIKYILRYVSVMMSTAER